MASQRCANPAYLSEVNGMMLEYSLYKTIQAHIELFKDLSFCNDPDLRGDGVLSKLQTSSASTLTEIHDSLICVIRANQTNSSYKQNLRFDTSLLQLLVLLRTWFVNRLETKENYKPSFSAETFDSLENERVVNHTYRRLWKHYRTHPKLAPDFNLADVWEICPGGHIVSLADHVVPRFIQISEELFSIFQGSSDKWMHLAVNLLTQSAIEVLSSLHTESKDCQDVLENCFAWGYVQRSRLTQSFDQVVAPYLCLNSKYRILNADMQRQVIEMAGRKAEVEDRLWEMFFDQGSSYNPPQSSGSVMALDKTETTDDKVGSAGKETPQSSGEFRSWSNVRQHALDNVLLTYTDMFGAGRERTDQSMRKLKERYPLRSLLARLTDFIEEHWTILHNPNWNGMPVLVQIEQGRLDGLNEEEFELFKRRASITNMP